MGFRVPVIKPIKTNIAAVDRFIAQLTAVLNPVFEVGTTRIQGFDCPPPGSSDNGKAYVWNWATRSFVLASVGGPLTPTGVTPGTYGDATHVGVFTVDAYGRLTFAGNTAITVTTSGATGGPTGDATTVPVITVVDGLVTVLGSATIGGTVPSGTRQGQCLIWNGSSWAVVQWPNYIDLPPVSPSSIDDEFDYTNAGSPLGSTWMAETGVATGTVDFAGSIISGVPGGTTVVDFDSEPGSMLLQASGGPRGVYKDISSFYGSNANVMVWAKVTPGFSQSTYTNNDSTFQLRIGDDTTPTNFVALYLNVNSGNYVARLASQANASLATCNITAVSAQVFPSGPIYVCLWRRISGGTTTWRPFIRLGQSRWLTFGSTTSTFTANYLFLRTQNAVTPNSVIGIDFLRGNQTGVLPTGG